MKKLFLITIILGGLGLYLLSPEEVAEQPRISKQEEVKVSCPAKKNREISSFDRENRTDEELAQSYFDAHKAKWGIKSYHEVKVEKMKTPLSTHFTYRFKQGEWPVVGMRIRLEVLPNGFTQEVENTYYPIPEIKKKDTDLESKEAVSRISGRYVPNAGSIEAAEEIIYYRANIEEASLAYVVAARDRVFKNTPTSLVLRASDAQVLSRTFSRGEFSHLSKR